MNLTASRRINLAKCAAVQKKKKKKKKKRLLTRRALIITGLDNDAKFIPTHTHTHTHTHLPPPTPPHKNLILEHVCAKEIYES